MLLSLSFSSKSTNKNTVKDRTDKSSSSIKILMPIPTKTWTKGDVRQDRIHKGEFYCIFIRMVNLSISSFDTVF